MRASDDTWHIFQDGGYIPPQIIIEEPWRMEEYSQERILSSGTASAEAGIAESLLTACSQELNHGINDHRWSKD